MDKLQFLEVLVFKFSNFTTDFALSLVYYDSISIIKNMLFLHCSVIYIIFVELMFYSVELGDKLMLIYSGLEVPGNDSSVGVDVSRRYALSTQLYIH